LKTLDVRAAAAGVIGDVLGGQSLNRALPATQGHIGERDRPLLQQLCYGTLREAPRLQALLEQLLDKPLRDKDRDITALLLCGLYQLDSTRVPDHAAVAATVNATRALKKPWAKNMTNAVLRRYLREREALTLTLDPAAANSHPVWLHDKILSQWPDQAAAIFAANNQQPPMTLRVNSSQLSQDACLGILQEQGIEATAGALSPHALQLTRPLDVWTIPGFTTGMLSVQDEAAQMAALLLSPCAGERVLDACAAPGGKACHILEAQPALAELVAMDIDAGRLQRVAENLARLKLAATLVVGNAAQPPPQLLRSSFDRILVDAPCTASGVIRRHPDVKLLRRDRDIAALADQQLQILRGLWPLLKPGGTLLYATCSLFDEENSQVVRRFVCDQHDASVLPVPFALGQTVACGRQLLPAYGGPDGLFYALVGKAKI
jgi:16S rRNA (cytosine967-C5)-methyltransferase